LQNPTIKGITKANDILITDTQLSSLDFIDLKTIQTFDVNNNVYLHNVSQSNMGTISGALTVAFNNPSLYASFPMLTTMQNGTFREVAGVSLPYLNNVTGDLGFIQNSFASVSLPNLTEVVSSLSFVNNSALTNVSAPMLGTVGGAFLIANNSAYNDIEFNSVTTVGGAVDWTGSFYMASMSSITTVRGGLNVQTTAKNFSCPFTQLRSNGVVQGNSFVCSGNISTVTVGTNGTNVTANSGSTGTGTSTSTATSSASHYGDESGLIMAQMTVAFTAIVLAVFAFNI